MSLRFKGRSRTIVTAAIALSFSFALSFGVKGSGRGAKTVGGDTTRHNAGAFEILCESTLKDDESSSDIVE
ncbi:hypothetical protein K440DRAFT_611936 [Wilcoxina mikolae CBS 423.85]|nr:hypothetical protein K440DRAFT_611936 [Wilcoxina mikolae CBS 423.85]